MCIRDRAGRGGGAVSVGTIQQFPLSRYLHSRYCTLWQVTYVKSGKHNNRRDFRRQVPATRTGTPTIMTMTAARRAPCIAPNKVCPMDFSLPVINDALEREWLTVACVVMASNAVAAHGQMVIKSVLPMGIGKGLVFRG